MKGIKDTNGKISCLEIGRINIKMSIQPEAMYRVSVIPIKLLMAFFKELEQTILKFVWTYKDPEEPSNLEKEQTKLEASHLLI